MESVETEALISAYVDSLDSSGISLSTQNRNLVFNFLEKLISEHGISTAESILPPSELLTLSTPRAFHVGTGLSVTNILSAEIADAQREVLFVTCFWASSRSREALCEALRELNIRSQDRTTRLRVRIGFSSSSFFQKLFHTSSPQGKVYPPEDWRSIGLPSSDELDCLDLEVKSLFFLPFSVLHGKFCIVDRRRLLLPSANISWETWGECCLAFEGPLVLRFVKFWGLVWGTAEETLEIEHPENWPHITEELWQPPAALMTPLDGVEDKCPTLFIPQPHHRNPRFFTFPGLGRANLPVTPQNAFMLAAVEHAQKNIYLQTPNLTSRPLINALVLAMQRGVAIEIVTCRRMMLLEQLITTFGTGVTEFCVNGLSRQARRSPGGKGLAIYYYSGAAKAIAGEHEMAKAVQSHVKCLLIDQEVAILGSANADRASWWTSQEVNVAVFSSAVARHVREQLVEGLGERLECVCGNGTLRAEPIRGVIDV